MSSLRTIVILGASDKPDRASNILLTRLLRRGGFDPVPVHPALESIAGVPVRRTLGDLSTLRQAQGGPSSRSASPRPDVLSVYLSPERSSALEAEIVKLMPGKVVFNPGAENPALEAGLNRAGIATENACSLVLLGRDLL